MAIKVNQGAADGESQVNRQMTKSGPLIYIMLFLVLGVTIYGFFLSFDKGRILSSTTELEQKTRDILAEIDTIKANKVEVSQNASDALKEIESKEIRWSEVIGEVDKLIPKDALGNDKVVVMSYSGSGQGTIALNMVTRPAALPPFEEVAKMLTAFNSSIFFQESYVPGISKSATDSGEVTLGFVLNTAYREPETGSESLQMTGIGMDDASKVAVPRNTETIKVPRNN